MKSIQHTLEPITKPLGKVFTPTVVKILALVVGLGLLVCAIVEFIGMIVLFLAGGIDWMTVVSAIFSVGYIVCYIVGGVSGVLSSLFLKHPKRDRICSILFLFAVICAFLLYGAETTLSLATNTAIKEVDKNYDSLDAQIQDQVPKSSIYAITIITAIIWIICNVSCLCCYFCIATCNMLTMRKIEKRMEGKDEPGKYKPLQEEDLMDGEEGEDSGVPLNDVLKDETELPELKDEASLEMEDEGVRDDDDALREGLMGGAEEEGENLEVEGNL